ncbi:autophagy-related protein 16 [Xylariaceae sp. FL1272]|nr:autophagy-related protein 16 [Xylariaceae sp. FL1272]
MPNWREEYLDSLHEVERNNPVNKDLVEACSQLADRVAALEAEKAALAAPTVSSNLTAKPQTKGTPADPTTTSEGAAELRRDLAEALRGRGQAQTRLKAAESELAHLRSKSKVDGKRISDLTAERNALLAKLRDRKEELDEKSELVKDVQDKNLALEIELNVLGQRVDKVQTENKELVDRWMKRMGHEADAMNRQNELPSTRR